MSTARLKLVQIHAEGLYTCAGLYIPRPCMHGPPKLQGIQKTVIYFLHCTDLYNLCIAIYMHACMQLLTGCTHAPHL